MNWSLLGSKLSEGVDRLEFGHDRDLSLRPTDSIIQGPENGYPGCHLCYNPSYSTSIVACEKV